jgi:anti-sigma B factor antagonist
MRADNAAIGRSLRPRGPVMLRIAKRKAPTVTVVEVGGEVDILTAAKLGTEIDMEVRTGSGDLVIDLRRTAFVDSAGLHILLNAQRRLTRQGRGLAVLCEPGPVRRVFELARLVETLGVVASLREYQRAAAARRSAAELPLA